MQELAERLTARIILAMTGTSSTREREDPDARNPTYLRNRLNGSLMREITILHSLNNKLTLALQNHLGIAIRAAVNMSELTQLLLSFQIVPNEEKSRKWLLQVQRGAQETRVARLLEWRAAGDAWAIRFDNCDVGKLLHFIALIATRLLAPPPLPFPFSDGPSDPLALRSTVLPALHILALEHYEQLSAIEVCSLLSWWECFDTEAATIQHGEAAGAQALGRAQLLRRVKGGLGTSVLHSGRALGAKLELEALGPAPAAPASPTQLPEPTEVKIEPTEHPSPTPPPIKQRPSLVSPPRRTATAIDDYEPSAYLSLGISVHQSEPLTILHCEPHDQICLVRRTDGTGETGELPTYIIGQGEFVSQPGRELWEMTLAERAPSQLQLPPNRMHMASRLLVDNDHMVESPLNLNNANSYQYSSYSADYVYAPPADSNASDVEHQTTTDDAASRVSNLEVRGKYVDSLLYLQPVLQKATDEGATQSCMLMGRLVHEEVAARSEATVTLSQVQQTPSFSADQQFHDKEWGARERKLATLVAERVQKVAFLEKASLDPAVKASYKCRVAAIEDEMRAIFIETFDLGMMHAVIYLQRSAFQIAGDILCPLIFSALPALESIRVHLTEVKEGLLASGSAGVWAATCCMARVSTSVFSKRVTDISVVRVRNGGDCRTVSLTCRCSSWTLDRRKAGSGRCMAALLCRPEAGSQSLAALRASPLV